MTVQEQDKQDEFTVAEQLKHLMYEGEKALGVADNARSAAVRADRIAEFTLSLAARHAAEHGLGEVKHPRTGEKVQPLTVIPAALGSPAERSITAAWPPPPTRDPDPLMAANGQAPQ